MKKNLLNPVARHRIISFRCAFNDGDVVICWVEFPHERTACEKAHGAAHNIFTYVDRNCLLRPLVFLRFEIDMPGKLEKFISQTSEDRTKRLQSKGNAKAN